MSSLAPARSLPRLRTTAPPPARRLRVVAGAPGRGQAAFVALCLALLVGGLLAVLLLNTSIAKGAFALNDLQDRSNALADAEDALGHAIDAQSAPAELARRALELGMVPASSPAFLRLGDGRVLGVAEPARRDGRFSVVAQAKAPAMTSAAAASAEAAAVDTEATTTVTTTSGSVTTTTVTVTRAESVERTVTSVDTATGEVSTSTATSRRSATSLSARYR